MSQPDFKKLSRQERIVWNMIPDKVDTFTIESSTLSEREKERMKKCPYANEAISLADGERDLLQIIHLLETRMEKKLSVWEIKQIAGYFTTLYNNGYISAKYRIRLKKKDIHEALIKCGLRSGEVVFVHSALSTVGYVIGGANTVIEALIEIVTEDGILAVPTFYDDAVISVPDCGESFPKPPPVPYDPGKSIAYTGAIPNVFWQRPDVVRSKHPTHSVAAYGKRSKWFIEGHEPGISAFIKEGPFGKILKLDGYFMFLGVDLTCCTFLHVLEDWLNFPYMPTAKVLIIEDGKEKIVTAPKYPEGHRDFYLPIPNKFTNAVMESGLGISSASLGLDRVQIVKARDLSECMTACLRQEQDLLLCDNDKCAFCVWAKTQLQEMIVK